MILKRLIPVFVFLFVVSLAFGQNTTEVRKPAKVVSSKTNASKKKGAFKKFENKKAAPIERKLASGKKMPADFPKYIDTGNKEKDVATYKVAKSKWINENPEKYQAIFRKD